MTKDFNIMQTWRNLSKSGHADQMSDESYNLSLKVIGIILNMLLSQGRTWDKLNVSVLLC